MIFDIINDNPGFISSDIVECVSPGIHNFIPTDDKQKLFNSLKEKPEKWYYRSNTVEYTINSHKFRTKEFKDIDWKNSIVLLGCSYTFGVGVTDDDTIGANLQRITGKNVVNLGQPGVSNSIIAYNSYYLKENYPTPIAVVNLWTNMPRLFWIDAKDRRIITEVLTSNNFSIEKKDISTVITNNIMHMKMSNALWKGHPNHIQTCMTDYRKNGKWFSITQKVFPEAISLKQSWIEDMSGRDNLHPGRETYKKIAKLIASNIKL